MPPVSPCGQVVDFVRSCQRGFWRLYPSRPDVLTPGYHYFTEPTRRALETPHSFGSANWTKDGFIYPPVAIGQVHDAGVEWYDGEAPERVPPDQFIFDPGLFQVDQPFPPPRVDVRDGFDERCYLIGHPGVDLDIEAFFRPDVTDCCWQRVLARLCELLTEPTPAALTEFDQAVALLWGPDFTTLIFPGGTTVNRYAWITGPQFQIVLRVGTQSWAELWRQVWHGLNPRTITGPGPQSKFGITNRPTCSTR